MGNRKSAGARIKYYRELAGLSQSELGARSGIIPNVISNWETGISYPQYEGIIKLCRALSISADSLLGLPHRDLTDVESDLLSRIRQLDDDGLHTVEAVIDSQLRRLGRL